MFNAMIDAKQLAKLEDAVIVDCRFDLSDTTLGHKWYEAAHIPGAVYAHLDDDLSSEPVTDHGRHPLPGAEKMRSFFGRIGITPTTQVVVYDQLGGALAARLWWMLRYMGHETVAVLNGGWSAWINGGFATEKGIVTPQPVEFKGEPNPEMLVLIDQVPDQSLLIDSRAAGRYAGDFEPLDPVAGHIPGAINYHFARNQDDGRYMLPKPFVREQMENLLGDIAPKDTTFYCGSGVTACYNILATQHAGLSMPKLYVGSWSEWSRTKLSDSG